MVNVEACSAIISQTDRCLNWSRAGVGRAEDPDGTDGHGVRGHSFGSEEGVLARFVAPGFEAIRFIIVTIVSFFVIIMRVANVCHAFFALRILVVVSGVADVYSPTARKNQGMRSSDSLNQEDCVLKLCGAVIESEDKWRCRPAHIG